MTFPIVAGVEFRAIEGVPGYCAGDDGSVWGCRRNGPGNIPKYTSDWKKLKPGIQKSGHRNLWLRIDGRTKAFGVHRLVLAAFAGECPSGMEACHNNGDPSDNRILNLRWDTRKRNHADKLLHGTNSGTLTWSDVCEIRRMYADGKITQTMIANMYGIGQTCVSMIVRNKTWRDVTVQELAR